MKQLLLCRHAKSSWKDTGLADIDRPLNGRGRKNAPEMGRRLAAAGAVPDLVVSSPACRALATAGLIALATGMDPDEIVVKKQVYDASSTGLLRVIQGLEEQRDRVMLVGHNPETTQVANILGSLEIANVPTCGIVALDFDVGSWAEVGPGLGTLVFFEYPKRRSCSRTT